MNILSQKRVSRILPAVALLGASACGVPGSGELGSEARTLPAFERVHVRAGLHADVAEGPQSVVVSGDDNLLRYVDTTVADGVLWIEPTASFEPKLALVVRVRTPELLGASLAAGGFLRLEAEALPSLELGLEAGGEVHAFGTVGALAVELSAGGELDASGLTAQNVSLAAEAGGELAVRASDAVHGLVKSGSLVRVFGAPAVRDVATASGGEVVYLEP